MKEEIKNLTLDEFWDEYSKNYDNKEYDAISEYGKYAVMYIGDFYEDGVDRDMLICSNYQHFELCKIEYFDEDGDYVDYDYSVCACNEDNSVEYHPNTKMSDVFDDMYYEAEERYLALKNDATSITD